MHDEKEKVPQSLAAEGDAATNDVDRCNSGILPDYACVDMLRFSFKHEYNLDCDAVKFFDRFKNSKGEFATIHQSIPTPISRYRYLYRIPSGDSSISVGLFLNDGTKMNENRTKPVSGFLEFNPQKVETADLEKIVPWLSGRYGLQCSRWDAAFDYFQPRSRFHLDKERSMYQLDISKGAITEYKGKRNSVGRVKLYDKGKEQKLTKPVTRLEVTCDTAMDFPIVYYIDPECPPKFTGVMGIAYLAISKGQARFEEAMACFEDERSKKRYRKIWKDSVAQLPCPSRQFFSLLSEVAQWEAGVVAPRVPAPWESWR